MNEPNEQNFDEYVVKVADISCAHVTQDVWQLLWDMAQKGTADLGFVVTHWNEPYGCRISLENEFTDEEENRASDEEVEAGLTQNPLLNEEFISLYMTVRKAGYDYLALDPDGPVVPWLPIYKYGEAK